MSPRGSVVLPRRAFLGAALALLLVVTVLSVQLASRARGADASRCERFAAASAERAAQVTGAGERVVVIGDSWSAGLGLARPARSWASRLPGRVHVAGFSGSGFSRGASPCGPSVAFDARAPRALRRGAGLVVVQGGLNDTDRTDSQITAGFVRLTRTLAPYAGRVVVVGPAPAPSRAARVPRVSRLLADLAARHGFAYVDTSDLAPAYLPDRLHLTEAGHRAYGDTVAARIAALTRAAQPGL